MQSSLEIPCHVCLDISTGQIHVEWFSTFEQNQQTLMSQTCSACISTILGLVHMESWSDSPERGVFTASQSVTQRSMILLPFLWLWRRLCCQHTT